MSAVAVAQSTRGQVLYCPACRVFHLEFGNLHISLWIEHLVELWEAVRSIDGFSMEQANWNTPFRRKIMIPVRQGPVNIVFSLEEIGELADLLRRAVDHAVLPAPQPMGTGSCEGEKQA